MLAGRSPFVQLNVDATRMTQAFIGSAYVQQMVMDEVNEFAQHYRSRVAPPVDLVVRARYNPNLEQFWFGALIEILNNVTMLSIILTGAALIREREHGTIEHLLVMPVTPTEIMLAKVWSMGLVVLISAGFSLEFVVQGILRVPIQGSVALFLVGAALLLFATTSMGIFMATLARSMPQFGLLAVMTILPMQMLSGNSTPRESMPLFVQNVMLAAPSTHFVILGQAILFRGAGLSVVWPEFLALIGIGGVFFAIALMRFRKTISDMV
jgi:ABC-2 type transport system permease protein